MVNINDLRKISAEKVLRKAAKLMSTQKQVNRWLDCQFRMPAAFSEKALTDWAVLKTVYGVHNAKDLEQILHEYIDRKIEDEVNSVVNELKMYELTKEQTAAMPHAAKEYEKFLNAAKVTAKGVIEKLQPKKAKKAEVIA